MTQENSAVAIKKLPQHFLRGAKKERMTKNEKEKVFKFYADVVYAFRSYSG